MAFKFSRKAFLTGGAAGVGLMALNVCGASAAAPAAAEQENCLNVLASKLTNVKVSQLSGLPGGQWQAQPVFPAWAGYVDDTLALNSMFTFQHYSGQGTLYVAPEAGVASFALFVNNKPINTAQMAGGGVYAVDISGCTLNGDNTIQVSAVQPAGKTVQVSIPYPVVIEGTPEQVGLDRDVLEALEQLIQSDVDNGFPSAQMAVVKNGRLVCQNAWGRVNAYLPDGTPNTASPAVTNDTLYDLASNSKMYTANYALQLLVTQGKIDLDSRIVDLLGQSFVDDTIDITFSGYENPGLEVNKQWKSELTLRDILRHQAGFPADPQYHNDAFDQHTQKPAAGVANPLFSGWDGTPATRQATLKAIFKNPADVQARHQDRLF